MRTFTTQKTQWKSTAIPLEAHSQGKVVAALERKPLGEILGEILLPALKKRHTDALRKLGVDLPLNFKRKNGAARK